jgi:hypothetical protein
MLAFVITVIVVSASGTPGALMVLFGMAGTMPDEMKSQAFVGGIFALGLLIASINALSWI